MVLNRGADGDHAGADIVGVGVIVHGLHGGIGAVQGDGEIGAVIGGGDGGVDIGRQAGESVGVGNGVVGIQHQLDIIGGRTAVLAPALAGVVGLVEHLEVGDAVVVAHVEPVGQGEAVFPPLVTESLVHGRTGGPACRGALLRLALVVVGAQHHERGDAVLHQGLDDATAGLCAVAPRLDLVEALVPPGPGDGIGETALGIGLDLGDGRGAVFAVVPLPVHGVVIVPPFQFGHLGPEAVGVDAQVDQVFGPEAGGLGGAKVGGRVADDGRRHSQGHGVGR